MADNTTLNTGTGGDIIRTIDRTTSKAQVFVIDQGGEASESLVDPTHPLIVQGAAGEAHLGAVGGTTAEVSANFGRPADTVQYTQGDLVANNTVAGSVTPLTFTGAARIAAGSGAVRRARLLKSSGGLTNASFRLHLFKTAPTVANGDNGAFSASNSANYLGAIDIAVNQTFTDGAAGQGVSNSGGELNFKLAAGNTALYGLIEMRSSPGYTPVSGETFTVTLEILQD